MANIRKIVSVKPEHYPNKKVAAKVKSVVLGNAKVKFFTRKDLANILKGDFRKAPNTKKFIAGVKDTAKKNGAYYVRFEA